MGLHRNARGAAGLSGVTNLIISFSAVWRTMVEPVDFCGFCDSVKCVSQSAEVLALKHESRILRQDECPRILLSCYRARNSGPDITSPKVTLLLLFIHIRVG